MNCLRDLQESRVVLVCQHLFNCQRKTTQKIIYANVHQNTINDGDSQTSLLPIFFWGSGTSVHRLCFLGSFVSSIKILLCSNDIWLLIKSLIPLSSKKIYNFRKGCLTTFNWFSELDFLSAVCRKMTKICSREVFLQCGRIQLENTWSWISIKAS